MTQMTLTLDFEIVCVMFATSEAYPSNRHIVEMVPVFGMQGIVSCARLLYTWYYDGYICSLIVRKPAATEQGKSEGFDSCDRPSNLKLDSNRQFFGPCDR